MYRKTKYAFILVLLFFQSASFAQVLNGGDDHREIKAEFVKENIKIKPREAFFNVLKIYNGSESPKVVILTYETPLGWKLISEAQNRLTIGPKDTLSVPLRASANRKVKGEIGYSIIASLSSSSGQPITAAYCFIKVPRKSNLRFRPVSRVNYIDQETKNSTFSFELSNQGNVDEVVYLNFTSSPDLNMKNEVNNSYSTDVTVPSKTDTVLTFDVSILENGSDKSLYRINMNGHTEQTRFNTSFWFKNLMSHYKYEITNTEIPLIFTINMENIFNEGSSYFSGNVRGNLLFRKNRSLNYYFHKYPSKGYERTFLQSTRFRFRYNSSRLDIVAGDNVYFKTLRSYGKGLGVNYSLTNQLKIKGKYSFNAYNPINSYGIDFDFNPSSPLFHIETNLEYSDDNFRDEELVLGLLRNSFIFDSNHKMSAEYGMSGLKNQNFSDINNIGYHYLVRYRGSVEDLNIRIKNRYDSEDYYGGFYGKNDLNLNLNYNYKNGYRFSFYGSNLVSQPSSIRFDQSSSEEQYMLQRNAVFRTSKLFSNSLTLYGESLYENFKSNTFYSNVSDNYFITHGGFLRVGTRLRFSDYQRLTAAFKGGVVHVSDYMKGSRNESQIRSMETRNDEFTSVFDLSYYTRNWGVFFKYNYGPYNGNQYYTYFYSGNFNQLLRLMPYYRAFIYKDILEVDSRLNYMYSINYKTHRLNWGNEIRLHLNYGLMLRLIGNFTLQSTMSESQDIQVSEQQKYTYSNAYFELRLEKKFSWNQPRIKYYDLNVNLFKDLNGNLKREYNEPGVQNVVVNIEKLDPAKIDSLDVNYENKGSLSNNRLLSSMKGKITYENIPQGVYKLKLKSVGKSSGKFTADQQEVLVHMNQDRTINIPYLERNKIFGKVILNRSKLSNLGDLSVANIKVTAVDSKGRKSSALTNQNGEFTIYAPSVDRYDVYINNIFEEHFDLRKNHYSVQLNGYKQFEVNFIFDEKRRKINFTPSFQEDSAEVRSVKRTNLSGVVKDQNTLQPIKAKVEVVDNTTGSTVETTTTDRKTGRFSMSFMTGTNYTLIVTAQGYWFYSERLDLDQMLTIQDVEKEILMENIIIGKKIVLDNLQFEPGSAEIPNDAYPELDRLIEQLKQNPNVRIQVAGHSDALETLENEDISVERAKAVTKYMMQNGFSNIEYVGRKDKQPVAPNDSEANRAKNRRVEIIIVDK